MKKTKRKMKVQERKLFKNEDWSVLIKIIFQLTGMKEPMADKIIFATNDDGSWNVDVGGVFSIYHDEEVQEVTTLRGKEKQLVKGYRWMTFETTYSYRDGYDVNEKERGFCASPQNVIQDIVMSYHNERVCDALEGFDHEIMEREEEAFRKQMEQVPNEESKGADAYDEMGGDYRERLEAHNRQVLSKL